MKERVVTVRMTPNLHAAVKELVHDTRADSMNRLCVAILTEACLGNDAARAILEGPEISPETPNLSPPEASIPSEEDNR